MTDVIPTNHLGLLLLNWWMNFLRKNKFQSLTGKLTWTHYCELMSISDRDRRSFYEKECEIGDVIDIHFVCRDNYGLGYDFFFQSWKVESEAQDNFGAGGFSSGYDGSEVLRLFWE